MTQSLVNKAVQFQQWFEDKYPSAHVLFAKIWGSVGHNADLPTSDLDYLVVYQWPTADILSLSPPSQTIDGKAPDFEAHEISKFLSLLVRGNPHSVECLFTDRMLFDDGSDAWRCLIANRDKFLTQTLVKQYLGYARGQLACLNDGRRMHSKGGEYNEKWAYHAARLLYNAGEIVDGHHPTVWFEGDVRDYLLSIRTGIINQENLLPMLSEAIDHIERTKPWNLPEKVDENWLNDWLIELRISDL